MKHAPDSKLLVATLILAGCAATALPSVEPAAPVAPSAAPVEAAPSAEAPPPPDSAAPAASAAPARTSEPTGASPLPESEMPAPGSPAARWMREHHAQTVTIRNAVVAGKIMNAVKPAVELTEMAGVEGMPKQWKISAEMLRTSAARIRESADVQEAAAATADIGKACGHCHGTNGRGPRVAVGQPPEADGSVLSRMRRHKWAAERLWEGLYAPSKEAWEAGAKALELDPFAGNLLDKGGVHARAQATEFNRIAKGLPAAKTPDERSGNYAKLLSTCAPCHEAMGVMR